MGQVILRSYEMIEEENKELKTMMRKLCHEMGNALTLLGGSIFYLENGLKKNEIKEEVNSVKQDYSYLCKLFNNLREYNHTEAIDKTNVDIEKIIDDIKDIFAKFNNEKDIELKVEKSRSIQKIAVYIDIVKLRQVFVNIIKNSVEAMTENGDKKNKSMVVRVSKETTPYVLDTQKNQEIKQKEIVHIEIRDNGKGISEKHINDIFKPLYTYGKENGSGLGLAVVKKIIEDHKGKIKAVSVPGTGTAMHIYLPVSEQQFMET